MALIIVFHNDGTGMGEGANVGNYNIQVLIGDGSAERSRTIHRGRLEGHPRDDGWQMLVERWLTEMKGPDHG